MASQIMSKLFILINASIFIIYGSVFVFLPLEALQYIVTDTPSSTSSMIDTRATYGGMSIGVGSILYLLARGESTLRTGLLAVLFMMACMASARLYGIIVDGSPNGYMLLYLILELVAVGLSIILLRLQKQGP